MSDEADAGRSRGALAPEELARLLDEHRRGEVTTEAVLETIGQLPFRDIGFARIDTHRHVRQGFPEVVLGLGKTREQVIRLVDELADDTTPVLVTRVDREVFDEVERRHPDARYDAEARAITVVHGDPPETGNGTVLVLSAGTSDGPVAAEAAVTARVMGNRTECVVDVGVAGIHRLLAEMPRLRAARVIVVIAGMEGALPSVVAGLVSVPVVAVPTSVGYGASFGGVAALLGMLNSCASGVTVVNIDNGFGAGFAASQINHL